MKKTFILLLVLILFSGCHLFQKKEASFKVDIDLSVYDPDNKEEFAFSKMDKRIQQYGYKLHGDGPNFKKIKLPYEKYVGMRGYIYSDKPISTFLYNYYPVILENGQRFYLESDKNKVKFKGSFLISYKKYKKRLSVERKINEEIQSFKPEPLIPKSKIILTGIEYYYGTKRYILSNGNKLNDYELKYIREISGRFYNKKAIAECLLNTDISYDKVENNYFVSPKIPFDKYARGEVEMYLGLNGKDTWLKFKTQYRGKSWIFANSFKVAADNYRWQSPKYKFKREYILNSCYETAHITVNTKIMEALIYLSKSKSSIIRFQGKNDIDLYLNDLQKKSIKDITMIYALMH